MENEYANFGLPSDPVNQPHQFATVQRGWFSRNVWWLLLAALLLLILPCGCCGGIFWWVIGSLKSSELYRMALHRVQTAPQVIEQIGEPIEAARWMPNGNFSYRTVNGVTSGEATFDFSVSGPKGKAHVHAEAVCRNGKWIVHVLEVTPASSEQTMCLPVDEKPGNAEKEDGED
jgi:hypothetical protein